MKKHSQLGLFIATWLLVASSAWAAERPAAPIRAAGIAGSVIVAGHAFPDVAIEQFVTLAKRGEARIVVIRDGSKNEGPADDTKRLLAAWEKEQGAAFDVLRIGSRDDTNDKDLLAPLSRATGVWLAAGDASAFETTAADSALDEALRDVLARDGVIAASPGAAGALSRFVPDAAFHLPNTSTNNKQRESDNAGVDGESDGDGDSDAEPSAAANDDSEPNDDDGRDARPTTDARLAATITFTIAPRTALLFRGRRMAQLGDGAVTLRFAPAKDWPDATVTLEGRRRVEDLTAVRRYARQRTGPLFPPREAAKPIVADGTLIIVGGGGMPRGLLERFVELAGGDEASIVVLPISMPDPLPRRDRFAALLQNMGVKDVTVLRGRTPDEVSDEETLAALKRATGVWFGGGRQWRFVDAYEGTKGLELMHDVLKRGGVIAGSSAGASIQGEYMARGNPLGPRDIMAPGYERGFGFLPGVAIDQHFAQRRRFADMTTLADRYPQLLGIGIDETTALVVSGRVAEVVGKHKVHFYDRRKPVKDGEPDHESVAAGQRYDLVARKVVEEKKEREKRSAGEGERE